MDALNEPCVRWSGGRHVHALFSTSTIHLSRFFVLCLNASRLARKTNRLSLLCGAREGRGDVQVDFAADREEGSPR